MFAGRASTATLRCVRCHLDILNEFAAALLPRSPALVTNVGKYGRHQTPQRPSGARRKHQHSFGKSPGEETQIERQHLEDEPVTESLPWYLKVQEQQQQEQNHNHGQRSPFHEQQHLPNLPSDPPPFLQPLLHHLSIDIGLDYLSLLDLRKIDPPPALGSNLLMIVGTTRSQKHLHVSADRLSRWLRTEHKLTPYADGLLGRNELKLKLKRKARRSKMMSAVGALDIGPVDDGINSGWICVTVGEVEGAQNPGEEEQTQDDSFVGFGKQSDRVKIVVQMMTEEKRGEMDLESLWQRTLDRASQRQKPDNQRLSEPSHEEEKGVPRSRPSNQPYRSQASSPLLSLSLSPSLPYDQQTRRMYSSSRHLTSEEFIGMSRGQSLKVAQIDGRCRKTSRKWGKKICQQGWRPIQDFANSRESKTSNTPLELHLEYLRSLPEREAQHSLGPGEWGKTDFLASFQRSLPQFLTADHWMYILQLQAHAIAIDQPEYTKGHLVELLREMEASISPVPSSAYYLVMSTILDTSSRTEGTARTSDIIQRNWGTHSLRLDLSLTFEVLERMEAQGLEYDLEQVMLALHRKISQGTFAQHSPQEPKDSGSHSVERLSKDPSKATKSPPSQSPLEDLVRQDPPNLDKLRNAFLYKFRKALQSLYPHGHPRSLDIAMLGDFAQHRRWAPFWDVWAAVPLALRPRDAEMYTIMFNGIAEMDHEAKARRAIETHVPELGREMPPVPLRGELAVAVYKCLIASKIRTDDSRWRDFWEKCRGAVAELLEARRAQERMQMTATEGEIVGSEDEGTRRSSTRPSVSSSFEQGQHSTSDNKQ